VGKNTATSTKTIAIYAEPTSSILSRATLIVNRPPLFKKFELKIQNVPIFFCSDKHILIPSNKDRFKKLFS
jgi:hypothetical protein